MIECRYNPIDLRYKNTIGAVKQGELLTIRIEINNALPCTSVLYKEFDDPTHTEIYRKMAKVSNDGEFSLYEVSYKPIIGLYWYCFELEGCAPKRFVGVGADNKPCLFKSNPFWWQLTVYDNQYKTPDWLNKGVMYHIFVDRFCSLGQVIPYEDKYLREWGQQPNYKPSSNGKILNNDFFGGNINGIISKLDYLATLNVKVIYLSPIFSAYSNHKYDTEDYETIDSMFGSEKDFKQLCKEAESRGMSIMLDGVFNHTGVNSKYFNRSGKWGDGGAYNDQSSPYYDWYKFTDWNNKKYQSWWDFDTLPVLNPRSSSLQEYFAGKKGIVAKWLRLGARGWRLDVVDEIADCMLDKIVYRAKNVKRDSVILGEVWEDASNKKDYGVRRRYFLGRQLDSVMNYPMRTAILNFVATGNNSLFNSTVFMILNNYPKDVRDNLMNMLSTHDTERALTFLGGKVSSDKNVMANLTMSNEEKKRALVLFRLASVLQYTVFGFPCVFYGDEAEMQGGKDPFCRGCYPWGNENTELLSFFKNLGEVRKEKVLYSGEFKLLGAPPNVVAFERTSCDETLQVMANRGYDYEFYLPCNYVELISGETYSGNCILRRDSAVILKRVTI